MSAATKFVPARRGDLAVIERVVNYGGSLGHARHQWEVAEVVSITREGRVTAVAPLDGGARQRIDRIVGFQRLALVPAGRIDKPGALAAVRAHHWPGCPNQLKPFDSVNEVRALLKPHRIAGQS